MLVFGRIAAPNVSTGKAQPQVNPLIARFKTFLASLPTRLYVPRDFFEVLTFRHAEPPCQVPPFVITVTYQRRSVPKPNRLVGPGPAVAFWH
jgi:hypothetical protein